MTGITDLDRLICEMEPVLQDGEFAFCTMPDGDWQSLGDLKPLGFFREEEGVTLILPAEAAAESGLAASAPMRMITLTVHSSLEAVGLTAAVSAALAQEKISANVVAAFHHDHIFVPSRDAERTVLVLKSLTER